MRPLSHVPKRNSGRGDSPLTLPAASAADRARLRACRARPAAVNSKAHLPRPASRSRTEYTNADRYGKCFTPVRLTAARYRAAPAEICRSTLSICRSITVQDHYEAVNGAGQCGLDTGYARHQCQIKTHGSNTPICTNASPETPAPRWQGHQREAASRRGLQQCTTERETGRAGRCYAEGA